LEAKESKQNKNLEPDCDFNETYGNTKGLLEGKWNCYGVTGDENPAQRWERQSQMSRCASLLACTTMSLPSACIGSHMEL